MRATVRSPDDEARLAVLKALPGAAERLTFWQADLLVPGSFDKAIDGVYRVVDVSRAENVHQLADPIDRPLLTAGATYVIHSASPVALEVVPDPENELVKPAVDGTKNVFESCLKTSKKSNAVALGTL